MTNPIIKIVDAATGEEFEREMNAQELAQWIADKTEAVAKEEAKAQEIAAKELAQTKLAALGLTTEDLKALGL